MPLREGLPQKRAPPQTPSHTRRAGSRVSCMLTIVHAKVSSIHDARSRGPDSHHILVIFCGAISTYTRTRLSRRCLGLKRRATRAMRIRPSVMAAINARSARSGACHAHTIAWPPRRWKMTQASKNMMTRCRKLHPLKPNLCQRGPSPSPKDPSSLAFPLRPTLLRHSLTRTY